MTGCISRLDINKGQGEELEGSFKKLADLLDGSEDRSPCPTLKKV